MTTRLVGACRRAEERDGAFGGLASEPFEKERLSLHLAEVARRVLFERDGGARLPPEGGVEGLTRAELRQPTVPGLVGLGDTAWTVTGDEQSVAVVGLAWIAEPLGLDHDRIMGRRRRCGTGDDLERCFDPRRSSR